MRELLDMPVAFNLGMASVAILAGLAWNRWYKTARLELPRWRNVTSAIGLAATTFVWVGTILVLSLRQHSPIALVTLLLPRPLSVIAFVFALTLKGSPRWFALAAAVVMYLCFSASIIA